MVDFNGPRPPAPPLPVLPFRPAAAGLPVGSVFAFAGEVSERTIHLALEGVMVCDGRRVPINEFHELYRAIGDHYTPSPIAGTFCVPDLRGYFLRGVDPKGAVDIEASGRTRADGKSGPLVGSVQQSAFQVHEHDYVPASASGGTTGEDPGMISMATQPTSSVVQGGGPSAPLTSDHETRPINIYVYYLIKYAYSVTHRQVALLSMPSSGGG